jgi:hypothetical protein
LWEGLLRAKLQKHSMHGLENSSTFFGMAGKSISFYEKAKFTI